jgi:hypothetical protein
MDMSKGFLNLPFWFWALLSLALAVVWLFVGPHTRLPDDASFRYAVIRWGHSATWLLLALSFFLRGLSPGLAGLANALAVAAGLVYALFIVMAFVAK